MAPELRPFIQEAHAVVRQRHLARHGQVPAADQPHIRDGMMWGAKRAGRDQCRAGAGAAGDEMKPRGADGFGHRYIGRVGRVLKRLNKSNTPGITAALRY
jgi:hypothetical protein